MVGPLIVCCTFDESIFQLKAFLNFLLSCFILFIEKSFLINLGPKNFWIQVFVLRFLDFVDLCGFLVDFWFVCGFSFFRLILYACFIVKAVCLQRDSRYYFWRKLFCYDFCRLYIVLTCNFLINCLFILPININLVNLKLLFTLVLKSFSLNDPQQNMMERLVRTFDFLCCHYLVFKNFWKRIDCRYFSKIEWNCKMEKFLPVLTKFMANYIFSLYYLFLLWDLINHNY